MIIIVVAAYARTMAAGAKINHEIGFDVIDAGPLRNARLLETHAMLWIELALKRGLGRDWAFARLKR